MRSSKTALRAICSLGGQVRALIDEEESFLNGRAPVGRKERGMVWRRFARMFLPSLLVATIGLVDCSQGAPKGGCNADSDCPKGATCSHYACNLTAAGAAGTVSGTTNGAPFSSAAVSYVIGAPDSTSSSVVYLFSIPVECSVLGSTGWDSSVPAGAHALELKMQGLTPGTFNVTRSPTPAPGEASVNSTLAGNEVIATGGAVTLQTITAGVSATGSFSAQFDNNESVNGTFNSTFCPGGHEP
jgi:hypothetical protein